MNPEDIYKAVNDAVEKHLPPVVERVVNGKINRLQDTLNKHIEDNKISSEAVTLQLDKLNPVIEGLNFLNSGRRFATWVKPLIPLLIFCGALYIALKKFVAGI